MPAFGLLARPAEGPGLTPVIPLANVPRIHLEDHLIGLQNQLGLHRLGLRAARLRIEFAAHLARPLPLPARLPIQRRWRQLHAGQMCQHRTGFTHRQLAGQEGRHVLHGRRVTGAFGQTQRRVGRHTPLAAPFTIATVAQDGEIPRLRPERARMAAGQAGELLLANRTAWRGGIGFGLGPTLKALPEQFPDIVGDLPLQVPEVLIARQHKTLQ